MDVLTSSPSYKVYVSEIDPQINSDITLSVCAVDTPDLDWQEGNAQLPNSRQHYLGFCLNPYTSVTIPKDGAGAYYSLNMKYFTMMAKMSGLNHTSFALITNQNGWIKIHSRNHNQNRPQWEN